MEEKPRKISDRLLDFGVEVVKITIDLNKSATGRNIAKQLIRAGTSAGTNYEETYRVESRADFIHKLQLVVKELREYFYWLRLVKRSQILKNKNMDKLIDETKQLCCIIAQSIITAKTHKQL